MYFSPGLLTVVSVLLAPTLSLAQLAPPVSYRTITATRNVNTALPSGTRCNARGSLAAANVLRDFISGPPFPRDACRDACFDAGTQCNSYAFHTDVNRCRLFRTTLIDQGFRTSPVAPNVEFYGKACWVDSFASKTTSLLTTNGAGWLYDDDYYNITLPFPVTFYGQTTSTVYMSVNGILGWSPPRTSYSKTSLPNYDSADSASYLPPTAICAFWVDNKVEGGYYSPSSSAGGDKRQSMSYTISGLSPARTVTFNWRFTYELPSGGFSYKSFGDVDLSLYEGQPNGARIKINEIGSDYGDATFGAQSKQANKYSEMDPGCASACIFRGNYYDFNPSSNSWNKGQVIP